MQIRNVRLRIQNVFSSIFVFNHRGRYNVFFKMKLLTGIIRNTPDGISSQTLYKRIKVIFVPWESPGPCCLYTRNNSYLKKHWVFWLLRLVDGKPQNILPPAIVNQQIYFHFSVSVYILWVQSKILKWYTFYRNVQIRNQWNQLSYNNMERELSTTQTNLISVLSHHLGLLIRNVIAIELNS